jgi:hypothetical protein
MALPSKNLTYKEKELVFCLGRVEQYWMLLEDKIKKRKLKGSKAERLKDKLARWEEVTYILLKDK